MCFNGMLSVFLLSLNWAWSSVSFWTGATCGSRPSASPTASGVDITVIPDRMNYAAIYEITDRFAPLIQQIDLEVDAIEDLVLLLSTTEQSDMVSRIWSCRKWLLQMSDFLEAKQMSSAPIKRFEERAREEHGFHHRATGSFSSWSSKSTPAMTSATTPAMKTNGRSALYDTGKWQNPSLLRRQHCSWTRSKRKKKVGYFPMWPCI